MKARHIILPLVAALAMGAILVGEAQAGKRTPTPPPPPPPPPNPVIAFNATFGTRKNPVSGIYKMNADGSNVRFVYPNFTRPSWSPDGSQLAVTLEPEMRRIDADGSNALVLATDISSVTKARWSPVTDPASPAYNLIAFTPRKGQRYELAVIGAEGARRNVLLPETYTTDLVSGCEYVYPDWSRDAQDLVAVSVCRAGASSVYAIIIVPLANPLDNYVLYGPDEDLFFGPRWARQRDALVFRWNADDGVTRDYTLELQRQNGLYSAVGAPTPVATDIGWPAWSPDDSKLIGHGVYTYEFATGVQTFLATGDWPDWKRNP